MERLAVAKKLSGAVLGAALALVLLGRPTLAAEDPWPKRFDHPQGTVVMYQPQLEDHKGDLLLGRAAVSVKKKEWKEPVFGAIWLHGRVVTDRDTRMATIDGVKVTDARFPGAQPEQLEKLKAFLNDQFEGSSFPISLDRLVAAMEVLDKAQAADQGLKNDPPRIIFAAHPAVLVPLDGDPKLLPVPKSPLMRVANTPFFMLYDPAAKTYYLKGGEAWLAASDFKGPWKDVGQVPSAIKTLEAQAPKPTPGQAAPKKVESQAGKIPAIIVSTEPAELLATDGEPQYTPVKDTNLLFISNTESTIFMDTTTQDYYALISGRWFKTRSLQEGHWAYVAPNGLPADFAKIPESSAKGFVLVSVAGTPQAKEAVLDNSIPQTAVIDRKKATTKVEYAGGAKFEKIPDTNLEYAVNSGKSVFKEGTKYYALDQGVWYEADSANGPWRASAKPPQEVDKIPPSNPNYNARYVKVYEATNDTVTTGYTQGYTGSYVDNGTVVYGTGYNYSGYAAPDAYVPPPAPATYGYAAAYDPYAGSWGQQAPYYDPASWIVPGLMGFGLGMLTGYAIWGDHGYYGGGGWWGPGGYNNININNIHNNINWHPDRHWDHGRPIINPVTDHRNNLYNRPGAHGGGVQWKRPGTETRPGAHGGGVQHPVTQKAAAAARPQAGTKPATAAKPTPSQLQAKAAGGKNNVLADKSGNVYRRDQQGNWQQRQGNQWSKPMAEARQKARPSTRPEVSRPPTRPEPPRPATRPSMETAQLNRDYQARQRGETRTQNFQRYQSFSRPSGPAAGAGGFRRAGGRVGGGGRHR
jgi:hypothetical protein